VAIRSEPFLRVRGTLAKDEGSLNVIAEEVRALAVPRPAAAALLERELPFGPARPASPYALLKHLRRWAPEAKSWG
jgi:hypothetical protein